MDAFIFDLDGTLVDSLQDIADATNRCLEQAGLPTHPVNAYRQFLGGGIAMLVRRAMPEGADFETLLAAVRQEYTRRCVTSTRAFAGFEETLDVLKRRAVSMAVLSNKPHDMTVKVVDAVFKPRLFEQVLGDRPGHRRKPDPTEALGLATTLGTQPQRCIFVGDTPIDIETARAAGMRSVAVTWGFRPIEELRKSQPDFEVARPQDLLTLPA